MSDQMSYKGPEYPTEAHGSIPAFNSYEEEATFWDTHDFTDFEQETTLVIVRSTRGLSPASPHNNPEHKQSHEQ